MNKPSKVTEILEFSDNQNQSSHSKVNQERDSVKTVDMKTISREESMKISNDNTPLVS
jgi:hypothetical protein